MPQPTLQLDVPLSLPTKSYHAGNYTVGPATIPTGAVSLDLSFPGMPTSDYENTAVVLTVIFDVSQDGVNWYTPWQNPDGTDRPWVWTGGRVVNKTTIDPVPTVGFGPLGSWGDGTWQIRSRLTLNLSITCGPSLLVSSTPT